MANNRMALVCKDCNKGISIAKYYPQVKGVALLYDGSGWGQYPLNTDRVNAFFVKHQHDHDESMWGGNQYDLRYEIDDDTWTYDHLLTGQDYIDKAIQDHGFVPDEREIANKPFAEFYGLTQNEYEAFKLVTYNAYQAPK